jgi:Cytochrome c554 and c-prime
MGPRAWRLLGAGLALGLLLSLDADGEPRLPRNPSAAELDFLSRHWRRPLPPQGEPPANFGAIERSLSPADCGTCHTVQFGDWKTSRHSQSMGPGIAGQLVELLRSDPASARFCLSCHAPLAEQATQIQGADGLVDNPAFDPALRPQGIVCAGCHVRGHQRFGPPARPGPGGLATGVPPPHGGFTPSSAFLRSEFCASCHQFTPRGFALNGKLLENTFEEWRASAAARRGQQCQDCHMPDRRHLWRGIHDPEMVKSGVRITLDTGRARYRPGDRLTATLTIASTAVGHYFPTYVTPKVVARAELLDRDGQSIAESVEERAIGRDVTLDLSREVADTRIPPGGRYTMKYGRRLDRAGLSLRVTVTVFPDDFYTRFFEALLSSGAGAGKDQITAALEATGRSPFSIFQREVPLT